MRAMPYPVPTSSVAPESWTLNGAPVTTVLPGWDYESLLQFERLVRVDVLKTAKEAGLDVEVPLALHVRYWATVLRAALRGSRAVGSRRHLGVGPGAARGHRRRPAARG